jgi:hypothetical protein
MRKYRQHCRRDISLRRHKRKSRPDNKTGGTAVLFLKPKEQITMRVMKWSMIALAVAAGTSQFAVASSQDVPRVSSAMKA